MAWGAAAARRPPAAPAGRVRLPGGGRAPPAHYTPPTHYNPPCNPDCSCHCRQYHSDIKKFLAYAMAKPGVWAVTMTQLLDWMEAPVGVARVRARAGRRGGGALVACASKRFATLAWPAPCLRCRAVRRRHAMHPHSWQHMCCCHAALCAPARPSPIPSSLLPAAADAGLHGQVQVRDLKHREIKITRAAPSL